MSEIWLEKYRPQNLDEICGNNMTIDQLKMIAKEGNIPNMILSGPPGIGKTSSILALARILLGQSYKQAVLELNASDERGIDTIREGVKQFAQKKVILDENRHKIIILDEADSLTEGAQQALRMIISDYSNSTRFVLSCNDSTKLIEPIQSRCSILRFTKVTDEQVQLRLLQIIQMENVTYNHQGLQTLIWISDGDMRQALNNLQAVHNAFGNLDQDNVYKVCDVPNLDKLLEIINLSLKGNIDQSIKLFNQLWQQGFLALDLVKLISKLIMNDQFEQKIQYKLISLVGLLKMRILDGLPSQLQFLSFLSKISQLNCQLN